MKRINKDKIVRIWSLIIYKLGRSKYNQETPYVIFQSGEKYGGLFYGEYTNHDNQIKIWWRSHTTSKEITSTMIHEYAHYLQYWPWYIRYMNRCTYDNNPYEVEAIRISELYEPEISRYSSDQEWKKLIKKDLKLKKIYESVSNKIVINI